MNTGRTKILYFITKGSWGGAGRYVYDLATSLPKNDFEVAVVLGEGEELKKKLKQAEVRIIYIKSLTRDVSFTDDWKIFIKVWQILCSEKPDIIHLNSSKIAGIGAFAGRLAGIKKIIFTGHGWAFNEKRPWWQKRIIIFISWITIMFSHKTIVVSKSLMKQISTWPRTAGKLKLIHNGIGPINFLSKQDAKSFLLPEKTNKIWIGTVAELHQNKGLDVLIEAFSLLIKDIGNEQGKNLCLNIIGEGEERQHLEKMIRDKHLTDQIILLGQVEDARKYLSAFDIFVLPSRTEALGYVLLEAATAGLPIVASRVGGIPEIIPDKECGLLVTPEDIKGLAQGLKYMITNDHYRTSSSRNVQNFVKNNFSIKQTEDETINLYKC